MAKSARLGVLVTYHDERDMLGECLRSLEEQDGLPDEVLIYDDASTHPAKDYAKSHLPCRILRSEVNHGPGYARNVLMHEACSEYIHFQDSDDLFRPGWFQMVSRVIEKSPVDVIINDVAYTDEKGLVREDVIGLKRLKDKGDLVRFCLAGALLTLSTTFRREAGLKVGGYLPREILPQSEDFDFHLRLALSGVSFITISQSLTLARDRAGSHSRLNRMDCWRSGIKSIERLRGTLPEKYRQDLAEAAARFGSELFQGGCAEEAKKAFAMAKEIGLLRYETKKWPYRILAKAFGPVIAEEMASIYRGLVPGAMRKRIPWGVHS